MLTTSMDMPDHTRYRSLISAACTPNVVAELEPVIRDITTRLIDAWIDDRLIEFGVLPPVEVMAHALKFPTIGLSTSSGGQMIRYADLAG